MSAAAIVTVGVLIATSVSGTFRRDPSLPATSPDALVSSVLGRHTGGYSGTINTQVDLGLPTVLRSAISGSVPAAGAVLNGLPHNVQYWYGATDKQRLALRFRGGEQDVFRNGSKLTTWNTATGEAQTGSVGEAASGPLALSPSTPLAFTPPQLADALLAKTRDDSDTTLRSGNTIAGRDTYELVLRPRSSASRIGEVQIQVDGKEFVPLGVTVYARDADAPSISATFTNIRFDAPAERNFTFTPPATANRSAEYPAEGPFASTLSDALDTAHVRGAGWATMVTFRTTAKDAAIITRTLGSSLTAVKGKWGRGREVCSPLICLVVTTKGDIMAGPVSLPTLYAAID